MVKTYRINDAVGGYIESSVSFKKKKGVSNCDIIHIKALNKKKGVFIDCWVYPEEAIAISTALMAAWNYTLIKDKHRIAPKPTTKKRRSAK